MTYLIFKVPVSTEAVTVDDQKSSGAFPIPICFISAQSDQPIFSQEPTTQELICEWIDHQAAKFHAVEQETRLDRRFCIPERSTCIVFLNVPHHPDIEVFYRWYYQLTRPLYNLDIIPETNNQRLYIRALQQIQSIKAAIIAHHICPTLPQNWKNLYLAQIPIHHCSAIKNISSSIFRKTDVFSSVYDLLRIGFPLIREWVEQHNLPLPYNSPDLLFRKLLEDDTHTYLMNGVLRPGNLHQPSKHQQRREYRQFRTFLRYSSKDEASEQFIHDHLWQQGWAGHWLLALRDWLGSNVSDQQPTLKHELKAVMRRYNQALVQTESFHLEAIHWHDQHPRQTDKTSDRNIEFRLDSSGFLYAQQIE